MSIEQMKKDIERYHDEHWKKGNMCNGCPLFENYPLHRSCWGTDNPDVLKENHDVLFANKTTDSDNPYWDNITKLANKQREKGLRDYGQGIEDNPAAVLDRLTYIEEELIDALMYLEWLREGIVNVKN